MYKIPFVYPISGFWMEHRSFDGTRMTRIRHGFKKGILSGLIEVFLQKNPCPIHPICVPKKTPAEG
jgi:hypothetical protein